RSAPARSVLLRVGVVWQNKDLASFLNQQPHHQLNPPPLLPGVGEHTHR
ncbi:MAG: hypothetical protein ACI8RZ_006677, partial [Myxococcota bacterium]